MSALPVFMSVQAPKTDLNVSRLSGLLVTLCRLQNGQFLLTRFFVIPADITATIHDDLYIAKPHKLSDLPIWKSQSCVERLFVLAFVRWV